MNYHFTSVKNVQMVIYLLKAYGIKRVIASPGATNVELVASMQQDPFFDMYSCVDERSAAYMACGIAAESGEPVVLSCTGATSARNYMPGLTEAYYRKLPVIAITSTLDINNVGHLVAQVTDRSQRPIDVVYRSVHIQEIKDAKDVWDVEIKLNQILNDSIQNDWPVHVNLTMTKGTFDTVNLPSCKVIRRYYKHDSLPPIPNGRVGIFVGEHKIWSHQLVEAVERFCNTHDAVVFCDHTSKYYGEHRCLHALVFSQDSWKTETGNMDLMIHIGEMSGDYESMRNLKPQKVWRVNKDGAYRDKFKVLDAVFAMEEECFFNLYSEQNPSPQRNYLCKCLDAYETVYNSLPNLPLSNMLISKELAPLMPPDSVVYMGILNTLRSWNNFTISKGTETYSNVGGFGIDGILSSLVGASLAFPNRLHIGILGDLSFFYDMNAIGNRDIKNNLRVIIVNNGHGQEFTNYTHVGPIFGDDTNKFIAARGHYGEKSLDLVRHYAQDLGFEYLQATNQKEFLDNCPIFMRSDSSSPIIFEVFTTEEDENEALRLSRNVIIDDSFVKSQKRQQKVENLKSGIKGFLKRKVQGF